MKIEKGSELWHMMADYYKHMEKYWEPEQTDEYWTNILIDGNSLCEKYNNNPFLRGLIDTLWKDCRRRANNNE